MTRTVKRADLGARLRVTVRVEGEEGTDQRAFVAFLQMLADNPYLLACDAAIPQRVTLKANDERFEAEAEAILQLNP